MLQKLWHDRRLSIAATAGITVLIALLAFLIMPRGPTTTVQALLAMFLGLTAGLAAGLAMKSRWAMLVTPAVYVITTEIAWLNIAGPTVDGIRLDETFGILAFVTGRVFYGMLCLLPMVLGASLGAWYARRISGHAPPVESKLKAAARWTPTVLLSIFLILLAIVVALPATTPPIVDANGKAIPGSIAELTTVKIGGHDQAILIRGHSTDKPVLLYLAGGPGQSDMALPRVLFDELEKDFIIVCWDQRGTGKSYSALDPVSTLTFDSAVSDTIEVTDYLRERFGEDKIYLMGESYGSILGVETIKKRPDLYHAYIGSGQMVNIKETDRRIYYDLLDYANRTGDKELAAKMLAYGEPPYDDLMAYPYVAANYEKTAGPYTKPESYTQRKDASGIGPLNNLAGEYTLIEKVNTVRGLIDMYSIMYPQVQDIDLRKDANKLDVPVYVLDAKYEIPGRRDLALEWYEQLDAPKKQMFVIDHAGHAAAFEGFEEFTRIMNEVVVPETYFGK